MRLFKTLMLALILGISMPTLSFSAETKEEKIELADIPAAVKEGFTTEVPGGEIKSAKKLTGSSTRFQIQYKASDGTDHQITLGEDGKPTRKKKEEAK
jgi:hypothetical protein